MRELHTFCENKTYTEITNKKLFDRFVQRQIVVAKQIDPNAVSTGEASIMPYAASGENYRWELMQPDWVRNNKPENLQYKIYPQAFIIYDGNTIMSISYGYQVFFQETFTSNGGSCFDRQTRFPLKGQGR